MRTVAVTLTLTLLTSLGENLGAVCHQVPQLSRRKIELELELDREPICLPAATPRPARFHQACQPDYTAGMRAELHNATHVLGHEKAEVFGLSIFGSGWCPWHSSADPDSEVRNRRAEHMGPGNNRLRFGEIPTGIDILLTHGPPDGIFDRMEGTEHKWGSSRCLREVIEAVQPTVHLFGHLHEQRGVWWREELAEGEYQGGVEYDPFPDPSPQEAQYKAHLAAGEWAAPPPSYPCQIISCNAMLNHSGMERGRQYLAGQSRVLLAQRSSGSQWTFKCVGNN